MAITVTCPNCDYELRLRDELAGKKIRCPKCQGSLQVPEDDVAEEEEAPRRRSDKGVVASRRSHRAEEDEAEEEPQEEERPRKKGRKEDWEPCPECDAENPKRVKFTWWGSFYFTKLLHQVKCRECGCQYNGRTGGSNVLWAILIPGISLLLIGGVVATLLWVLHAKNYL
jgi:uncharacterized paraquat-inducible protein A